MTVFLITVALTNLLLGVALRLLVAPPATPAILVEVSKPAPEPVKEVAAEAPATPPESADPATPVVEELQVEVPPSIELPPAWKEMLKTITPQNHFVEAAAMMLKMELGRYRNELVNLEVEVRSTGEGHTAKQLEKFSEKLKAVNADWLTRQAEIVRFIQDHSLEMGPLTADGEALCAVLDGQAAQIETTANNLLNHGETAEGLIKEVSRLVIAAHGLRDQMHDSLTAIMRTANRLGDLTDDLRYDSPEVLSRVGFEELFRQWRAEHPKGKRQASMALFEIDKLGNLNSTEGTRLGDVILASVFSVIVNTMRKDRGFDRVARVGGNSLVLFMADTGPRGAFSAAERMRQTIEVVTLAYGTKVIHVRLSAGIAELASADDSKAILAKLDRAVQEAKRLGGNCTAVDEGAGPKVLNNATYKIPPRTIRIEPTSDPVVVKDAPSQA